MTLITKYHTEAEAMAHCARYPRRNLIICREMDGRFHVYDMETR